MNKKQIEQLQTIFGENHVLTDVADMIAYSYDASHAEVQPEAVVFATTTEQISQLMQLAYREKIPVTPRGQGSGLSGGSIPLKKGIVLCMDKMNRVIDFDPANRLITVEAGMTTADIDPIAAKSNLFYPPDPGQCRLFHHRWQCRRKCRRPARTEIWRYQGLCQNDESRFTPGRYRHSWQ